MPTSSAISMEKYAMVLSISMSVTPCLAEHQCCWGEQLWREQRLQFRPFQDFVLQQPPREMFQGGFFLPKELAYQLVGPRHNGPDLRINFLRCLLAVRLWPCRRNARQERRGRLIVAQQAYLVTHAIGRHHGSGHVGDFAQVVVGSRGNIAKHQLFGDPATE